MSSHPHLQDVKPSNLLLSAEGTLQLADFGLARRMPAVNCEHSSASRSRASSAAPCADSERLRNIPLDAARCLRPVGERGDRAATTHEGAVDCDGSEDASASDLALTNQIASRWYRCEYSYGKSLRRFCGIRRRAPTSSSRPLLTFRCRAAPEVLLGSVAYDFGVDTWAAGCVMAELIELSPLVPGASDLEQIFRVLRARGTPSREDWPGMADLPDASKLVLPTLPKPPLAALLPNASLSALDLLERLLAYNPDKRLSAAEVRRHRSCAGPDWWVVKACAFDCHGTQLRECCASLFTSAGS